jgi:hypothetical protein
MDDLAAAGTSVARLVGAEAEADLPSLLFSG